MSDPNAMGQAEGALSRAANVLVQSKSRFDQLARTLQSEIESTRSSWKGAGGDSFQALGAAWARNQGEVNNKLLRFEESLRATEKTNTGTDQAQASTMSRYQQKMGG